MSYVFTASLRARPGREERLAEVLVEMVAPSRAEPGNRGYFVHRLADDPAAFLVYERYADEAAYQAHRDTEHYQRLIAGEAARDLLDDRALQVLKPLGDDED